MMTCRQMGGQCNASIRGNTATEMMKNGAAHIKEMVAKGDKAHKKDLEMMEVMQKDPAAGKRWQEQFEKDFAKLK